MRDPAQHHEAADADRGERRDQRERQQTHARPEVPVEEAVDDRGDGRVACRGAAVGVEHGGGRGVALHRAHRELGPQRPPDRQRTQVDRGVPDLHQPGRPFRGELHGPRAHGDDLPERHDVAARRERDRGRYAHEQAERHERDGRPLAQGGPAPASVVQGGPPPAGRTGVPSMRRAVPWTEGAAGDGYSGSARTASSATSSVAGSGENRSTASRTVATTWRAGRPPCAPRARAAVPARTAPCRGGAR